MLPPPLVISMLNNFFKAATKVIDKRGGVVVNYIGDAMIAAFNAPLPAEDHAIRAVDAARDLLLLVAEHHFEGHWIRLRIGVSTGPVAAGTVGGEERQTYTLYGDTVNVAQRLEGLNKEFETDCLISGATFEGARLTSYDAVAMGEVQVRGRENSIEVFAVRRPGAERSTKTAPGNARGD